MTHDIRKDIESNNFRFKLLMTVVSQPGLPKDIIDKIWPDTGKGDRNTLTEMKLTLNGYELDAIPFIDEIERQMDRMVKEEAAELIKAKFSEIMDDVNQLGKAIKDKLKIHDPNDDCKYSSWED